ncbi:TetR/AcrR family transcriptional regulator [Tritonibacter horizontis]|uniref:Fatty acid metabolism regulator protein n=1 Tax=Tritonibacter horizontis TaxID=1768241 RepID=A0A132C143_9RHOB|nr:TetR/AcrR family transcriptional regulator [Tritonibacter horizontis]KUP94304.1 fatty acid metabolism regulator protein [Tritonibacter horizontis]
MTRAPQKRRLETRAKLLTVAKTIVATQGYSALRVEDVVAHAGVAKGTFFSHFGDKDGLLAVILGARMTEFLDEMEATPPPTHPEDIAIRLTPMLDFVAQDRVIFDLLLRYSGTTGAEVDAVITESFTRQITMFAGWIAQMQAHGQIRADRDPALLAEGIQAFLNHVLALGFCMEHEKQPPAQALAPFLSCWLVR